MVRETKEVVLLVVEMLKLALEDELVELEVSDIELLLALIVSEYMTIALTPPQASFGAPAQATAAAFDVSEGLRIVLPQMPKQ